MERIDEFALSELHTKYALPDYDAAQKAINSLQDGDREALSLDYFECEFSCPKKQVYLQNLRKRFNRTWLCNQLSDDFVSGDENFGAESIDEVAGSIKVTLS